LASATNIADGSVYMTRSNGLGFAMDIGMIDGRETGITTYQGAGAVAWAVP